MRPACKAASDPLGLYDPSMGSGLGGITRSGSSGSYTYAPMSGRENRPVNYVSWYDVVRFVNWLHNDQGSGDTETGAYTLLGGTPTPSNGLTITRNPGAKWWLPSEDEWYKAAYHLNDGATNNYFVYPTGSNTIPTATAPPGGSNAANFAYALGHLTTAGAYFNSGSPYGTFDQGGNAWEWNESLILGTSRGLRGGSFENDAPDLAAANRNYATPNSHLDTVGFRVAAIPESSSLALGLAGLGLVGGWLLRNRRR